VIREVDALADRYVEECIERYPEVATILGAPGHDHEWSDYSPDGLAGQLAHLRATIADLHALAPVDERENVAKETMLERLGLETELHEAHIVGSRVAVIASPVQRVRSVFDLMPTDSEEAWRNIATRLGTIHRPLRQIRETLTEEAQQGNISARRQLEAAAHQIRSWTGQVGTDDFFTRTVNALPAAYVDRLGTELNAAADGARQAFADFASWLLATLSRQAPRLDAVGADRYALHSRSFLGAVIDLEETYRWGFDELWRIKSEQRRLARVLMGSDDIGEAYATLDADPARLIHGPEAFRDWMQRLADQAIDELAVTHFDIPEPVRRIECCLAPTHDGSIYYTQPSADFVRPGRMWWSVPEEIDTFSTWKETSTVYHEGVPGHHLQLAQTAYRSDLLNRWQRQRCFVSGHAEGWALYAERLMDDLGYLADPGDRLGMQDAQAHRAVRVIIDIGMHLQLAIPRDNPWAFHPGEHWDADLGLAFLRANTALDEPSLRFEINRYLGWPGQAPSYKVGERIWLQARDEARARKGAGFDLRRFHSDALNLGQLGLDPLRAALARL
jgi:uncharacterized protein (DUF885 family)